MSLSSSGNFVSGLGPFAVLQTGTITKVAQTPLVVPCVGILATDIVLYSCATRTAGIEGEQTTIDIATNSGQFTATSTDATFAGTYRYVVVRQPNATIVVIPVPP